jgi:hypothetical protein
VKSVEEHDDAGPVHQAVMCLQEVCGSAALEVLDQRSSPQRPRAVQRRLADHLRELEQLAHTRRLGQPDPAHVIVDIEVGIRAPGRRSDGQHRLDNALA